VEECAAESGYDLLPTLRFAHSLAYLGELAQGHDLRIVRCERAPLRQARGAAVDGIALHLQRA
jgi:predicted TPR repeat methyltransferase